MQAEQKLTKAWKRKVDVEEDSFTKIDDKYAETFDWQGRLKEHDEQVEKMSHLPDQHLTDIPATSTTTSTTMNEVDSSVEADTQSDISQVGCTF